MPDPLVSIVLPVFNAERYLPAALGSMLAQGFTDWEMICIDDGSRDASGPMLDALAERDSRVRVVHQENAGLVATLNRGIAMAKGALICRMDSDDIAMPERLDRQVAFLREHPEHVAVGGAILKIDADSDPLGIDRLAADHEQIEQALLQRRTGLFHPTTLIRASALSAIGGYRSEYEWVEDHDLWLRLALRGRLANLPEVVLCYRLHAGSICWQRAATQRQRMNQLLTEAHALRGLSVPPELLLAPEGTRSAAGPGKWARMAAKGYAPRTAVKHLRHLWREPAGLGYRLRMTAETLARLAISFPQLPLRRIPSVPKL
ncbi:MAG: glycosyltransferase family 2 protein [Aureliella sp.]